MDVAMLHELFEYRDGCLYWKQCKAKWILTGAEAGYDNGNGYKRVSVQGKKLYVHRIIFAMFHGFMPEQVDHIDCDRSNNAIENLRAASNTLNSYNKTVRQDSKTQIKGVHWHKLAQKWCAYARKNGKKVHLGIFNDVETAQNAVRLFRIQQHGEFARHA